LLPALGDCGVQVCTGTLVAPTLAQVTVTKPFPAVGDCGVQVRTPVVFVPVEHVVF
jgi:hypothetical protein